MLIFLWAFLSLLMFVAVDMFSFSIKRTGWSRVLGSFLLFYSQIIVTEFLLGLISALSTPYLVVLNLIVSGAVFLIARRKFGNKILSLYWKNVRSAIHQLRSDIRKDRLWLGLLIVAGALLAWILFLGVLFPATDFDGNTYHLTFIAYAIQDHTFFDVPSSIGWLTGYPKGGEFIEMWNVIVAQNDMFVDLVQVPFALLGVGALYEISRRLGVERRQARFAALLFLFLPVVLNQLKTTYIDVMLVSLFFAGMSLAIKTKIQKLDLVLLGIIMSLLISVKYTGFLFSVGIAALLFWSLYRNRDKSKRNFFATYVKPLFYVIGPTLFGLYWYVKNFVLYGNPLFPFGLKLGSVTIFPGKTFQDLAAGAAGTLKDLPATCADRIWFVWTEQKDWFGCMYNYDTNYAGLGPIWFIILVPAFILSLYFIIRFKNRLYMFMAAIILLIFAAYPINYYSRYTMFITILGIVSLGIVLSRVKLRVGNGVKLVTIILAISVFATNFTLCNFPPSVVKDQIKTIAAGGDSRSIAYRGTIGQAYIFLEHTVQSGETVAYDSSPYFIYPLWKQDYSNRVVYIPAGNRAEWLNKVQQDHVRYIFIDQGSKEGKWLEDGTTYKAIYKDAQYEIYQVY